MNNIFIINENEKYATMKLYSKKIGHHECYIDMDDIELVDKYKWCVVQDHNTFYCVSRYKKNGKTKTIRLHRLIMNASNKLVVDHRDRNGLNNRRKNLRVTTVSLNGRNMTVHTDKKDDLPIGIYHNVKSKYFRASYNDLDGNQCFKHFSTNKYGYKKALLKALRCRIIKGKEYNYDVQDVIRYCRDHNIIIDIILKVIRL